MTTQDVIHRIEKEFGDSVENVIEYFNNPKNDYMDYGFGSNGIAGILEIEQETLRKICKLRNIKIKQPRKFSPLDDICWTRYGLLFHAYLCNSSFSKRWSDIINEIGLSIHTLHKYYDKLKLYKRNPYAHGSEQKRKT